MTEPLLRDILTRALREVDRRHASDFNAGIKEWTWERHADAILAAMRADPALDDAFDIVWIADALFGEPKP